MMKSGIFCLALICIVGLEAEKVSSTEKASSREHRARNTALKGQPIQIQMANITQEKALTVEKEASQIHGGRSKSPVGQHIPIDHTHEKALTVEKEASQIRGGRSKSPVGQHIPIDYTHDLETCGLREVYKECGPSCEAKCADGPKENRGCIGKCKKGCFCANGLLRHQNGTCVLPSSCQNKKDYTCPTNQHFSACGQPPTCQTCAKPQECTIYACNKRCNCNKGYLRAIDGSCIPKNQCPKTDGKSECPENEEIVSCVKPEWCNTCELRGNCKLFPDACQKGCDCKAKHLRNEYGFCVPEASCPGQKKVV